MFEEIICAGSGGQGIVLMGTLLVYAGMQEGREVSGIPSYGAEMRGGTANYGIVISDEEIACPIVFDPTSCLIMNPPSLEKFLPKIRPGGFFIINSSLIKDKIRRSDIEIIEIPATEMADKLGNIRCANMIVLGAYAEKKGIVSLRSLQDSLMDVLPKRHHHLLKINQDALEYGHNFKG